MYLMYLNVFDVFKCVLNALKSIKYFKIGGFETMYKIKCFILHF